MATKERLSRTVIPTGIRSTQSIIGFTETSTETRWACAVEVIGGVRRETSRIVLARLKNVARRVRNIAIHTQARGIRAHERCEAVESLWN